MKKNTLLSLLLMALSVNIFANAQLKDHTEGKELHDESCLSCHMVAHNKDFYTRKNHKMTDLFSLKSQVSRCSQAFQTGWFPEEEQAVLAYLNHEFYKFEQK